MVEEEGLHLNQERRKSLRMDIIKEINDRSSRFKGGPNNNLEFSVRWIPSFKSYT